MVTPDQARQLTSQAIACRPTGARRWDAAGVMAAIKVIAHWSLAEVMVEVATAAADMAADTPGVIGKQGRRWQANVSHAPDVRPGQPRCTWCGRYDGSRHPLDHVFSPPTEQAADPERTHRIVAALKDELLPIAPTPEPQGLDALTTRRPELAAAAEAIAAANPGLRGPDEPEREEVA